MMPAICGYCGHKLACPLIFIWTSSIKEKEEEGEEEEENSALD